MGANKNEKEAANGNKRARAADARERKRRDTGQWQWKQQDWLYLAALVQAMAKEGGAVRIGVTRDGGALALGLYHENDYATEYIRPNESVADAVTEIADVWLEDGGYKLDAELMSFQQSLPEAPKKP